MLNILFVSLVSLMSFSVIASNDRLPDEKLQKVLAAILSQADEREKIVDFLSTTNISAASLEGISNDLKKKMPKSVALPVIKLEGNQVYIGGKPSGLEVTRFQPLSLRYKGKQWSYVQKDSALANYQTLTRFLEKTSQGKSALMRLMSPVHAQAFFSFDTMWDGVFSGGLLGVIGGAFIGYATGVQDMFKTAVIGGGIGAILGGILGHQNATVSPNKGVQ